MYKTLKISLAALFVVAAALAALLAQQYYQTIPVSAQEETGVKQFQADGSQVQKEANDDYQYKAQAGDSYTLLARKAVQTYGIDNKVNLTQAGIVFAETHLTIDAGSPELEVGQEVKISKESVKKYVEAAQKLSDAEQGAWDYYAPSVDFNTDAVGQA